MQECSENRSNHRSPYKGLGPTFLHLPLVIFIFIPIIFILVAVSKKWFATLPPDLQKIVEDDAAKEDMAINPWATDYDEKARGVWTGRGGELISLPPEEQSSMMEGLASVGDDVSKKKPAVAAAYQIVTAAAHRVQP